MVQFVFWTQKSLNFSRQIREHVSGKMSSFPSYLIQNLKFLAIRLKKPAECLEHPFGKTQYSTLLLKGSFMFTSIKLDADSISNSQKAREVAICDYNSFSGSRPISFPRIVAFLRVPFRLALIQQIHIQCFGFFKRRDLYLHLVNSFPNKIIHHYYFLSDAGCSSQAYLTNQPSPSGAFQIDWPQFPQSQLARVISFAFKVGDLFLQQKKPCLAARLWKQTLFFFNSYNVDGSVIYDSLKGKTAHAQNSFQLLGLHKDWQIVFLCCNASGIQKHIERSVREERKVCQALHH